MILKNDNGVDYKILDLVEFNGADIDYYKNSWQKFMYGLFESPSGYVVASMIGDTSWGQGHYFDLEDRAKATAYFERLRNDYVA